MQIICDPSGTYDQPLQSTLANPASWLLEALTYGRESDTGVQVNWRSALSLSAAWYCVNTISGVVGQTPLCLYERKKDRTSEEEFTHLAGKLMRNPMLGPIGSFHFRNLMQNHALLAGNGRAYIVRNGRGEPIAFIPLPAERTTTVLIGDSSQPLEIPEKWHVIFPETGEPVPLPDRDVLHIFRFSWDGYNGVPVLDLLRNAFGLGIAHERSASKFHKQGGTPSFFLEAPKGAFRNEQEAQAFMQKFETYHSGLDNAQRVGLLREGIQAKVLGLSQRDSQMLEQREFSVKDIMRIFGMTTIPGVETTQAGYNGLEQLNRGNLIHCFGPWMTIWQEECGRKLLTEAERRAERYFFAFDTWELVKPDANTEADMLTKYVTGTIIEANEAREVIGYGPHPDGKGLRNPATTKFAPEGEKPKEEPPEEPNPASERASLIAAKLKPLVSQEMRRVNEMAGKARHFIDWAESYYAKHEQRMTEAVVSVGGQPWMAAEYIEHSRYLVVQCVSGVQKNEVPAKVEEATASWLARADELAATIAGEQV